MTVSIIAQMATLVARCLMVIGGAVLSQMLLVVMTIFIVVLKAQPVTPPIADVYLTQASIRLSHSETSLSLYYGADLNISYKWLAGLHVTIIYMHTYFQSN